MEMNPLFSYQAVGKIHHVALLHSSGEAVRQMLQYLIEHVDGKPLGEINRVLLDFRKTGLPPMVESIPHILPYLARQPRRYSPGIRVAYLYPLSHHGLILSAFLSFQRFIPQGTSSKFFTDAEYDSAVQWLLN